MTELYITDPNESDGKINACNFTKKWNKWLSGISWLYGCFEYKDCDLSTLDKEIINDVLKYKIVVSSKGYYIKIENFDETKMICDIKWRKLNDSEGKPYNLYDADHFDTYGSFAGNKILLNNRDGHGVCYSVPVEY